jgi:iron complex outermembrane recepter protein
MTKRQLGHGPCLIRFAVVSAVAGVSLALSGAALSADARADADKDSTVDLEEVQVTGSRIKRASDYDTANPTTVIDDTYLKSQGIVNVGDAMKSLPSNVSNFAPTTTGNSNFFAGSTIANLRGLNPFFGSRTLNLVDGRRYVPTNQGDGVDLNFIPSILIDRLDVVTGGASAVYGSGAISGVNNVFLNRKLSGFKVEGDFGQSIHSDGRDRHAAAAFGTSIAGDRGHVTVGVEYQKMDELGCMNVRDWCARNVNLVTNPAAGAYSAALGGWAFGGQLVTLANPRPTQQLRENVRAPYSSAGVIAAPFGGPLGQVNAAGNAISPFTNGVGSNVFYAAVVGGEGRPSYRYTNLRSPVERTVATGTFNFKLTDSVNLTTDISWGHVETDQRTGALDDGGFFGKGIRADNAYVLKDPTLNAFFNTPTGTPALTFLQRNAFFAFPVQLNKDWASQLDTHSAFDTKVKRFSAGLDGKFGESTWDWNGYYQYGKSERTQLVADNRHLNAYDFANDPVFDSRDSALPVAQRRIECRITQQIRNGAVPGTITANQLLIAQGCVPLNSFGTAPLDPAAKAYAFGFLNEATTTQQHVASLSASGTLSEGWGAGAIQAAAGIEYRYEKSANIGSQNGAPDYVRNDYLIQYGESFGGNVRVSEVFGELNVPMIRDKGFAHAVDLNVASRYSRYKNTGTLGPGDGISRTNNLSTWKASLTWDLIDGVRLRGTRSRDARAANFRELYYGQIIQAGGLFGFCTPAGQAPGAVPDPCTWSLEGNVDVKPEKADTTTVGIVFVPVNLLEGFEFAMDYFHIKIGSAIQQANVGRVRDGCQISGIKEFCDLLTPDPLPANLPANSPRRTNPYAYDPVTGTGLTRLRATSFNGSLYNYRGVDFSSSYRVKMGDLGGLNFRLLATKMIKQEFSPVPGQAPVNITGQTGTANSFLNDNNPSAKWNAQLSSTYLKGAFSTTLSAHFVGKGKKNYLGVDPSDGDRYITAPANFVRLEDNHVPSYTVFGLNANYDLGAVAGTEKLDLWVNVSNLFDRDPPLIGGGTGGTQPIFFDGIGRFWKAGFRAKF